MSTTCESFIDAKQLLNNPHLTRDGVLNVSELASWWLAAKEPDRKHWLAIAMMECIAAKVKRNNFNQLTEKMIDVATIIPPEGIEMPSYFNRPQIVKSALAVVPAFYNDAHDSDRAFIQFFADGHPCWSGPYRIAKEQPELPQNIQTIDGTCVNVNGQFIYFLFDYLAEARREAKNLGFRPSVQILLNHSSEQANFSSLVQELLR